RNEATATGGAGCDDETKPPKRATARGAMTKRATEAGHGAGRDDETKPPERAAEWGGCGRNARPLHKLWRSDRDIPPESRQGPRSRLRGPFPSAPGRSPWTCAVRRPPRATTSRPRAWPAASAGASSGGAARGTVRGCDG